MKRFICTDDGYIFERLKNGIWTDGDMTYRPGTFPNNGLEWDAVDIDGATVYCADGDGIITVEERDGQFSLFDQGEKVYELGTSLAVALSVGAGRLSAVYPEIYRQFKLEENYENDN